jgi:hypothetical protein
MEPMPNLCGRKSATLEKVSREQILSNGLRVYRTQGAPLWATVSDLTGLGSTSSIAVCNELGLDPDAQQEWEQPEAEGDAS